MNSIARTVGEKSIESPFSAYGSAFFIIYLLVDIIVYSILSFVAYKGYLKSKMIHGDAGPPPSYKTDQFVSKEEKRVDKMFRQFEGDDFDSEEDEENPILLEDSNNKAKIREESLVNGAVSKFEAEQP